MATEMQQEWEEYIHITSLIIMGLLMFISLYEVFVSSINDQPKIKYRFTTMLFCFVQLLITLLSSIYLYVISESNTTLRHSLALLMRLCGLTGRILGLLCCYSFLLTIIKSLYRSPTHKKKIPRWFKQVTNIFFALIILLDIIVAIIAFINGTTYPQTLFLFILNILILLFCVALFIVLCGASKLYQNNISSNNGTKYTAIPKKPNIFNIDEKAMRSKCIKIYLMICFNLIVFIIVIIAAYYIYQTKLKMKSFPSLTESPMASIHTYLIYTTMSIIYIISLLYWLYIPKSLCCHNITCCCILSPSIECTERIQRERAKTEDTHTDESHLTLSTEFDLLNLDTWRDTFRGIETYRTENPSAYYSDGGFVTEDDDEQLNTSDSETIDGEIIPGLSHAASQRFLFTLDGALTAKLKNHENMKKNSKQTVVDDQSLELSVRERASLI